MLKVISVSKVFGGLKAINNVSFELQENEILGLIGPNGSGKTTLVNLISGAFPLSGGDIVYAGKSIKKMPSFRRARLGISRTFQIEKPFMNMTVKENVMASVLFSLGAGVSFLNEVRSSFSVKSVRDAMDETEGLLAFTGLEEKGSDYAGTLSLPERKKLELARALAMSPRLLLLDEVMAGLNTHEIDEMIALIKKTRVDSSVSIIVIEHIMKAVMNLADRIIVLNHGELIAQGTPQEVCCNKDVISAYLGVRYEEQTNSKRDSG